MTIEPELCSANYRISLYIIYMRYLLLFILSVFTFLPLAAAGTDTVYVSIQRDLSAQRYDQAVSQFCHAADLNIEEAALFYWTALNKNLPVARQFIQVLAVKYRENKMYDKAFTAYRECLRYTPHSKELLQAAAEVELQRGKEDGAVNYYSLLLKEDEENLPANIFLGNYFYWKGEKVRNFYEQEYRRITSPTKMQYASYRNKLEEIYHRYYEKAEIYLNKVMKIFPSSQVRISLEEIKELKREIIG